MQKLGKAGCWWVKTQQGWRQGRHGARPGSRAGQQLDPTVPETHCEDDLCLLVMQNH